MLKPNWRQSTEGEELQVTQFLANKIGIYKYSDQEGEDAERMAAALVGDKGSIIAFISGV